MWRFLILALPFLLLLTGCKTVPVAPANFPTPSTSVESLKKSVLNPPLPPTGTKLPPKLADELPKDKRGRPILLELPGPENAKAQLIYDETLDDPITRWSECLGRVLSCAKANQGIIGQCINYIEVCKDDKGGKGCCPRPCIEKHKQLLAEGLTEAEALDQGILRGDCVPGFDAMDTE